MSIRIESRENSLVKRLVRLSNDRKFRKEMQEMVCEGEKMLGEALSSGMDIHDILLAEDAELDIALLRQAEGQGAKLYICPSSLLGKVSNVKTPQGVAAVCAMPPSPAPEEMGNRLILLENVQDPGNVGTIIRTADAAGLDGVLLSNQCADVFSPKVLRATMGSIFRMNLRTTDDLPGELTKLREKGYSILSSQLDGTPFYERQGVAERFALIIGNEGNGVSEQVQQTATHRVRLPMRGGAESLNAAIAAAIMMYELMR